MRLCLDGVPMHAWAADITERLIGRTCALEQIETDLVHPVESGNTRTINLWAWTANPSTIPKRMWLGFTNRPKDQQIEILFVEEKPPESWQRGVRHPVLFHLEEIHDYSAAGVILTDEATCQPSRRRLLPWNLGVMDSEPIPARAFETFPHHPPPPSLPVHARLGRGSEHGDDGRADRDIRRSRGDDDDRDTRRGRDTSERDHTGKEHDDDRDDRIRGDRGGRGDHGDRDTNEGRRGRGRRRGERPWRRRSHNNDTPDFFDSQGWRRRDQEDDDDDGHGRRDLDHGRDSWKHGESEYRRDRTRSPRPRDREYKNRNGGRRNHRAAPEDEEAHDGHLVDATALPGRQQPDSLQQKESDATVSKFQFLLALHASALKDNSTHAEQVEAGLLRAATLLDKVRDPVATGDEAWSQHELIPVKRVFARINNDLRVSSTMTGMTTSLQEVEAALTKLELTAEAAADAVLDPALSLVSPCWAVASLPTASDAVMATVATEIVTATGPHDGSSKFLSPGWTAATPAALAVAMSPTSEDVTPVLEVLDALDGAPAQRSPVNPVDQLFMAPPQAIMSTPPTTKLVAACPRVRLRRLRKQVCSGNKRRSARIAKQPALPTMERCQRVLFKRMGWLPDGDDAASLREL